MALPNITGEIIAQGYNCHVRVGKNVVDAAVNGPIALVASFHATQDFQVQETRCIGNHGPVALDSQGYTCSGSIDGFLPFKQTIEQTVKRVSENEDKASPYPYEGGGKISIMDIMPTRALYADGGQYKIAYMDFYNKKAGKVLASFSCVVITSGGISAEGNAYVRNGIQFQALEAHGSAVAIRGEFSDEELKSAGLAWRS